ncbi:glycosyl transferase, group 2 family protein domain protein [Arcticibacter svalbardensis MN12-7]|uniref:Glycosyl transferase, group 2 family protein domain protein n=1 Tax=Arcticibacter svalbardensis MN12-7 TaxID=1150600 RepID=R9GS34_9SPHI|nr:glycosyltransferase [Arcticibacter svalbardensis]EOR94513.1 glycosyl transferase, group 2 family protein domain protein [Arcticibacter svalbardensis MN12-7]
MNELPLVSCVMPTYNRRSFIPHAIKYFLRQEFYNKELIIIDDGTDCIEDLIPKIDLIKYIRLKTKITLGAKLNMACSHASGSIIVNWDDDDWYASHRIKYQVEELKRNNSEVCGINNLLYYDITNKKAFEYKYPLTQRKWLLGSSLCYQRSLWEKNKFKEINVGMDGLFVWATAPEKVTALTDLTISVHMIHDQNISVKKTTGEWWHDYPVMDIERIMDTDLKQYIHTDEPVITSSISPKTTLLSANPTKQIKNVYACLVHESLECVIDMVRNLHFQDKSSIILIFNSEPGFKLSSSSFPFDEFGAIVNPVVVPVKHGYLHDFALECMQFALDHFSFDILTIVDSDQLSIQSGYSAFMGDFFSAKSNIGLLSNRPERLTPNDTDVYTSIQAFKEYELWEPLLKTFKDGENKFLHWSFWPSTVFTFDAVKDLVKLFKTNILLQNIMQRTKIWATEEIILPTMVSLLGYEIELNPCCPDYVNYQKSYSTQELDQAFNHPHAFWVHPVSRKYDDAVRKYARKQLNHYIQKLEDKEVNNNDELFFPLEALHEIQKIEGWFSNAEAELLLACGLKACNQFPVAQVVEIGSYHGKATVLLGKIARSVSDKIKVYAIDLHTGILGSVDQGLHQFAPSLPFFKRNIEEAKLADIVIPIVSESKNVKWELPISFLLIDGLHDYLNVSNDFTQFAASVQIGGYVAFHDYADYYPDVMAFVSELISKKAYQKFQQADSLLVLQKIN